MIQQRVNPKSIAILKHGNVGHKLHTQTELPNSADRVLNDHLIRCQNSQAMFYRLAYQHFIERVSVMVRQTAQMINRLIVER